MVHQLFAQTRVAARNSRLSFAEAILTDYYQDMMAQNVAQDPYGNWGTLSNRPGGCSIALVS